jgi:hypothetical protein
LSSVFVKLLGDVQIGERRKVTLKITSRFIEPIDVIVETVNPDGFFLEVVPSSFRLRPGESRVIEVFLFQRDYSRIGLNIIPLLIFKATTAVETIYREARPVLNVYAIDLVEVVLSPRHASEEGVNVEVFGGERVVLYKTFFPIPPYQTTLPITAAGEVVESEIITVLIPSPIAEAPDVPLVTTISHPLLLTAPDQILAVTLTHPVSEQVLDTILTQDINHPEVTWS